MKIRAVAAAALALALGAGLTGCNMISPQRTEMEYAASDGVHADLGSIDVRNALLIVDTDATKNTEANLVLTAVNSTMQAGELTAAVNGGTSVTIPLEANKDGGLVKVGFGEAGPQVVTGEFVAGETAEVVFTATYTDADGAQQTQESTVRVPILGASDPANVLLEYQTLAPGAGASTTPSATPTSTPTPTAPAGEETAPEETTQG